MPGILYVVGTPIGNLEDFSPRAQRILSEVDFIAAEDTRVTVKLLNRFGIKKPLVSYYEHNLRERGELIIKRILSGETCAVVSDAGMPCISDPGEDLVRLCAEKGIRTEVVPGPSAAISALCVSGLVTSRFCFEGFLSTAKKSRREHLESLKAETRTMIFYEAPHKLVNTLTDFVEAFGDRKITVVRELTKIHEEILRFSLPEAVGYLADHPPRGEFVLILEGAPPKEQDEELMLPEAVEKAKTLVKSGMRASDAAKQIAKETSFSKSEIYAELMKQ